MHGNGYLGDAPGLRKVATAMLRAHRARTPDPPAFGVSLAGCLDGEDALLAALCDARVPHAAFDACGRLAPPPGPRVPPFGVTLVVGGAPAPAVAGALARDAWPAAVWIPKLQPDFNVSVFDGFDARLSAVLRELHESNRFVQKSAESTSI